MALSNTSILIKRSSINAKPTSLRAGELAYSYKSNTLFFGSSDGLSSINIGGLFYTSTLDSATNNNTGGTLVKRDGSGNASFNTIYGSLGTNSGVSAGSYGSQTDIPVINVAANGLITGITTSTISTTLEFDDNNGGTGSVNLLNEILDYSGSEGIVTSASGNTISFSTDNTVLRSNVAGLNQTVDGILNISGELNVTGNISYTDVETIISQNSLILLANNNISSDVVDIGFVGQSNNGTEIVYTGLFRHAGDSGKNYYLFDNYTVNPEDTWTINPGTDGFALSTLQANIIAPSIEVTKQLTIDSGNQLVLNNGNDSASISIYNGISSGNAGLFVDTLQYNETSNVVFYDPTSKELTYGTMSDLRPDAISNGSYAMTISGTDGLVIAPAKILAAQSSGTTDGGYSFSGTEGGYDTGMFSATDGVLDFYSNNVLSFRISDPDSQVKTYLPLILANGSRITDTSTGAISFGNGAAADNSQGTNAVAIGTAAGATTQGWGAVAIGHNAGNYNQGQAAIAIGELAGQNSQSAHSIILNASGNTLDSTTSGLFIKPVRYTASQDATYDGIVFYNTNTNEVRYSYALDGGDF